MLQRITGPFREFGLGAGALYSIDRVLGMLSPRLHLRVYELMVQPIATKPLLPASFARQFQIREILPGAPELLKMEPPQAVIAARFAQNATCLGAYKNDAFVGYMWFCFGRYEEDEVRCTFELEPAKESVFDFDFYLYPEHRMGLGFVALWNGANQYLTERGIRYTFSRLTRFNLASRRAHKHLGWKVAGRSLFLQLFGVEIMAATVFPFVGLSVGRGRVRLALRPDALSA